MDEEKKKRLIKYIRATVFWAIAFVACIFIEEPYNQEGALEVVGALCNCFTVPGVIFAGIAGLSYISYQGGYDGLGYAFTSFGLHNIFTSRQPKKYKTLYDYKVAKDERGRAWLPHFLVVGVASLAIGIVLLIVYFMLG